MVTSENDTIHTLYILHICTFTYILDVSKWGVLGSADDDIAFFLHIMTFFYWSWVDPLLSIGFSLFRRCFSWFFIDCLNYMVQPKVILPPWWQEMDFKKKRRTGWESGRHSNPIYLVLKPREKIRDDIQWFFIILKMFFIIFQWFFIILKMFFWFFIDFSLFSRCCSFFSLIFHYFQDVFHYCSLFSIFLQVFHYFSVF